MARLLRIDGGFEGLGGEDGLKVGVGLDRVRGIHLCG